MEKAIKLILAILLFVCLADMPYGYYQLVRFLGMAGFAYLAYQAKEQGRETEAILLIFLAVLFQPFIKVSLGRSIWNMIDVIVGILLVKNVIASQRNNTDEDETNRS